MVHWYPFVPSVNLRFRFSVGERTAELVRWHRAMRCPAKNGLAPSGASPETCTHDTSKERPRAIRPKLYQR